MICKLNKPNHSGGRNQTVPFAKHVQGAFLLGEGGVFFWGGGVVGGGVLGFLGSHNEIIFNVLKYF